jgi:hypothetical protein
MALAAPARPIDVEPRAATSRHAGNKISEELELGIERVEVLFFVFTHIIPFVFWGGRFMNFYAARGEQVWD